MNPADMLSSLKSGGTMSAVDVIRQPVVILRLVAVVCAIIVFGTVASGGRTEKHVCLYNDNSSACSYAIAVGVFAFLGLILFLVGDWMFERISNIKKRRHLIMADLGFSSFWTFLWFVSFCLLTNRWTTTSEDFLKKHKVESWQENNVRAAIVFSLVSTGIWAGITFFALQRFRAGQSNGVETSGQLQGGMGGDASGYSGIPEHGGPQTMPQQPQMGEGQYYTPTY